MTLNSQTQNQKVLNQNNIINCKKILTLSQIYHIFFLNDVNYENVKTK